MPSVFVAHSGTERTQYLISAGLIISGFTSLIQVSRIKIPYTNIFIGTGLVSVMGTSFTFLPIAVDALEQASLWTHKCMSNIHLGSTCRLVRSSVVGRCLLRCCSVPSTWGSPPIFECPSPKRVGESLETRVESDEWERILRMRLAPSVPRSDPDICCISFGLKRHAVYFSTGLGTQNPRSVGVGKIVCLRYT